jgi:hypothetical protein
MLVDSTLVNEIAIILSKHRHSSPPPHIKMFFNTGLISLLALCGSAVAQLVTSTVTPSSSSAPTSTVDLFFLGAFGMQNFGTVSVVTQGPSTTVFSYDCTGWYKPYCGHGATIVEGPSTYEMVFPNFSEL